MPKGASPLPSVDDVLTSSAGRDAVARHGHAAAREAVRGVLGSLRPRIADPGFRPVTAEEAAAKSIEHLAQTNALGIRPVINLTGTVLHTNLGRALLSDLAIEAAVEAMRSAVSLEFDLGEGQRGERDEAVRGLLRELTGAEDATVVNNNAAAVLIVLNTLAAGKDAIVSRGELIEIGGSFRMPDIMIRAGARLVEVGTTNRTHVDDYALAIGRETGLILKVHTSNYRIEGFTKAIGASELAALARSHGVTLVNDLGSGTLADLRRWGLPHEPTVMQAVAEGADLVTFSGDKLMGGPQAGFVLGRKDLIAKINRNPMKRAVRLDKIRLAALEATLKLYRDPDRLAERLPTLRLIARPRSEIEALARHILPALAERVAPAFEATVVACESEIGSGALPLSTLKSAGLAIRPRERRGRGARLSGLSRALRALPTPVIGRIEKEALFLDLRCLENEQGFVRNIAALDLQQWTDGLD